MKVLADINLKQTVFMFLIKEILAPFLIVINLSLKGFNILTIGVAGVKNMYEKRQIVLKRRNSKM